VYTLSKRNNNTPTWMLVSIIVLLRWCRTIKLYKIYTIIF